jgi:RNA polymerase sigma factor (sigma-70 family)
MHHAARGFRGERGLRTWALRITTNLCRDRLRRRKHSAGPPEDLDPLAVAGLTIDPTVEWDEALDRVVLLAALEREVAALPKDQREALILRDRVGLSYAEVAESLHISEDAVRSRLSRARTSLKQRMKRWLDRGGEAT